MFDRWSKHFQFALENSENFSTLIQVPNNIYFLVPFAGTIYRDLILKSEILGSKLSLPGIAFKAKYNLFDQNLAYVFSFSSAKNQHNNEYDGEYVRELFRSFLIGGISNIYHRLVPDLVKFLAPTII